MDGGVEAVLEAYTRRLEAEAAEAAPVSPAGVSPTVSKESFN